MVYRQGSSRKSGLRSVSGQEHSRKPPVKASRFGQNVLSSGHDWVGKKKKVRDFKPLTCDFSGRDDWIRTSGLTVPNRARYQTAPRPEAQEHIVADYSALAYLIREPTQSRFYALWHRACLRHPSAHSRIHRYHFPDTPCHHRSNATRHHAGQCCR